MKPSILQRYIGKTITQTILAITAIFLGLDIFLTLVAQKHYIGRGNYGILQALEYVFLLTPSVLYQLFPMSGLLGSLVGLSFLANKNELVVMRAAGMSIQQIIFSVVQVALVIVFFVALLGAFVAPLTTHYAKTQQAVEVSGGQALTTNRGTWVRNGDDFVHIRMVTPHSQLHNISIYSFNDKHQLTAESYAQWANFSKGHWWLHHIVRSTITDKKVTVTHIKQRPWDFAIDPDLLKVAAIEPDQMPLWRLLPYIDYLKANNLSVTTYALSFWQRIFQPLSTLVMILLAVPFIFGPLRSVSAGLRVIAGVGMGFSFYLMNQFFGPFSVVYQFPPVLAASLPTLLFALLAYYLIVRTR